MATIPSKVSTRLAAGLKKFAPILESAKARDVNESDTSIIVTDVLHELFGYDKYAEITREHAIRGTFCDLAIKVDGDLSVLIEVKAIGMVLKDAHVKQAVDYAANQGCDYVALTNGISWRVYKVLFEKPIENEIIVEFSLLELNSRKEDDLSILWLVAKEGWKKERLGEYVSMRQALSRFSVAAALLSEPALDAIRRELRRMSPDIKIDTEQIEKVLRDEIIKREVLEGDKADQAKRLLTRAAGRALRGKRQAADEAPPVEPTKT